MWMVRCKSCSAPFVITKNIIHAAGTLYVSGDLELICAFCSAVGKYSAIDTWQVPELAASVPMNARVRAA
jgi:hypothetical protein